MSKISQDFINNVRFLYEDVNSYENDFLNEESQYYDAESAELVEDILFTISTSMVYEGYSAQGIVAFLADSSEQDILERFLNFDENILTESTVPEEYILEQITILDQVLSEAGRGQGLRNLVNLVTRIASKPTRMRVNRIVTQTRNPEVARRRIQNLAQDAARKGRVGGYGPTTSPVGAGRLSARQSGELLAKGKMGQVVQKVKDIGTGAKAALSGIARSALIGGTGVLAGYGLSKLGGGGGEPGVTDGPKRGEDKDAGIVKDYAAFRAGGGGAKSREEKMSIRDVEALGRKNLAALKARGGNGGNGGGSGGDGGSNRGGNGLGSGSRRAPAQTTPPPKPEPAKPTDGAERRTPTGLELRRAQEARAAALAAGKSKEEAERAAVQAGIEASKPTQGPKDAQIDIRSVEAGMKAANSPEQLNKPAPAGTALAAEQDRRRKLQQQAALSTTSESYDAFDIVLEYLTSGGHVDTLEEALYVMMEMDSETIGTIVEAKKG